jgi:ankyrin repeat protein
MAPPEWDLLLSAAQKNEPDRIKRMIDDDGVDPCHSNAVGQSALHIAALWGNGK